MLRRMGWKPALRPGVNLRALKLSPLETLVASRLDGRADVASLAHLTGLPSARVGELLERLVATGAVPAPDDPGRAAAGRPGSAPRTRTPPVRDAQEPAGSAGDDVEAAGGADPAQEPIISAEVDLAPPTGADLAQGPLAAAEVDLAPATGADLAQGPLAAAEVDLAPATGADLAQEPVISAEVDLGPAGVEPGAAVDPGRSERTAAPDGAPDAGSPGEDVEPTEDGTPDDLRDEAEAPPDPGTHRKLFETLLHPLELDTREARARDAVDPELTAFCFDPAPKVILALLENPRAGLSQARLVALHHRHPTGLEAVAARAAFAGDTGVRRNLVRNPQLPAGLFRRLWAGRRMLEQWKLVIWREVPEHTRRTAREVLRQRFATGPAEERVELILKTEGRCLVALTGLPIDSKTTALLCGRSYGSTIFIQNIARWSAAPPPLIAHLLRQELVRRNPVLRALLQRHPNAPSSARS